MWRSIPGLALALVAAGAAAEPSPHPGVADPIAFMAARYADYRGGNPRVLAIDDYASARLRGHLYAFDQAAGGQEVDSLDFWIDGTDGVLTGLGLTLEPQRRADRQTIIARFRNRDRPVTLRFHFIREGGSWYLDEAVKPGRRGWTLTGRLAMRPTDPPNP